MTNKLGILLLAILASVSLLVTVSQHAIASFEQEAADLDVAEAENATSTGSGTNQTASDTNSTG